MMKIILGVLISICALLSLNACDNEDKTPAPIIRPVKAMVVEDATSRSIRNFPGKVIASEAANLSFEVPGLLIEFPILEGDAVGKGSLIAKLDPEKYQEAVNEAEAIYVRSEAQFKRAEQLIKNKYLSQSDYDIIRSAYLVAKTELNIAKRNLADTEIRAPFTGIIAQKYVDTFQHIHAHEVVAMLHDNTYIDIEIDLPERLMIKLKQEKEEALAQHIKAIFDAKPDTAYPVTFKEVSTEADPETQTYRIVFKMPMPKELNVLPGMTVTIRSDIPEISTDEADKYFLIPSSAIFNEENATYVWLINPDSMVVQKTPVKVGRLTGSNIQVTAGIKPKDIIVIAGVHFLQENQKVKILQEK